METNKYSRGKIYRIVSDVSSKQYIGSTIQPLSHRMGQHRKDNNCCESKKLFQEDGVENCRIILIENYPCNSKEELLKRERYYIDSMDCINQKRPLFYEGEYEQIKKDYYEKHKEYYKELHKQYHIDNKEKLNELSKHRYQENKELILKKHKDYYNKQKASNPEQYKQYYKNYRQKCGNEYNIKKNHQRFIRTKAIGLYCFGL